MKKLRPGEFQELAQVSQVISDRVEILTLVSVTAQTALSQHPVPAL